MHKTTEQLWFPCANLLGILMQLRIVREKNVGQNCANRKLWACSSYEKKCSSCITKIFALIHIQMVAKNGGALKDEEVVASTLWIFKNKRNGISPSSLSACFSSKFIMQLESKGRLVGKLFGMCPKWEFCLVITILRCSALH